MDPTWVVVRNAFQTTDSEGAFMPTCPTEQAGSVLKDLFVCVCVVSDETTKPLTTKKSHTTLKLHAWPGARDGRWALHHSRTHLQTPPPPPNCDLHHFLFFVDPNWCSLNSSLVFVSTLNHDLAWSIAQQLFTQLQNKQSDFYTQYRT